MRRGVANAAPIIIETGAVPGLLVCPVCKRGCENNLVYLKMNVIYLVAMQWNMLVDFKLVRNVQPTSQVIKPDVRHVGPTTDLYDTPYHTHKLPLECILECIWTKRSS